MQETLLLLLLLAETFLAAAETICGGGVAAEELPPEADAEAELGGAEEWEGGAEEEEEERGAEEEEEVADPAAAEPGDCGGGGVSQHIGGVRGIMGAAAGLENRVVNDVGFGCDVTTVKVLTVHSFNRISQACSEEKESSHMLRRSILTYHKHWRMNMKDGLVEELCGSESDVNEVFTNGRVTYPIDESTFLSADLLLLESIEFKQRTKHILEIIEEVKWQHVDPDMLTSPKSDVIPETKVCSYAKIFSIVLRNPYRNS
ncbi:hypothetical protein ACSQ67_009809 [Phaseolus vulgaris]